jgi:hypothetical protein
VLFPTPVGPMTLDAIVNEVTNVVVRKDSRNDDVGVFWWVAHEVVL